MRPFRHRVVGFFEVAGTSAVTIDPNDHDHFVLRQRIRLVINQYEFALKDESEPFCFVEQARFKFKEDIRFWTDDSKLVELMRIKARQRFDPWAAYDITASDGKKIGEIQKAFGESLIRSTYLIHSPSGTVRRASESQSFAASSGSCRSSVTLRTGCRFRITSRSSGTDASSASTSDEWEGFATFTISTCRAIRAARSTGAWSWPPPSRWTRYKPDKVIP
jgi:hypothetical protein